MKSPRLATRLDKLTKRQRERRSKPHVTSPQPSVKQKASGGRGVKAQQPPAVDRNFIDELRRALHDTSYASLGKLLKLYPYEIQELRRHKIGELGALDHYETWVELAKWIDDMIGRLMAIRHELNTALAADRQRRAEQRERILNR